MAKVKLTAGFVEKIVVEKQTDYHDEALSGFLLRVSPTGSKSYGVLYSQHGKPTRMSLGPTTKLTLPEAREAARKILRDASLGKDPAGAERAARNAPVKLTFGEVAESYMEKHAKAKKKSWETDQLYIDKDLAGWKKRPVTEIGRPDITRVLDAIIARGAGHSANRVLILISTIYNWASGRGDIDPPYNPAYKYKKPTTAVARTRVLNDAEIKAVWKAVESKPAKQAAFIKLCLYTAQRPREVLGMTKSELDFERAEWTLPAARSKNKKEHLVPLSAQALTLIEGIKNGTEYLFPMGGGRRAANTFGLWIDALRDELKFATDWTCRDFRRTAATGMARNGTPRFIVGCVLNHSNRDGVTGVYVKYDALNEKREALTGWANALDKIVA